MTRLGSLEIDCPECNIKQNVTIWESVNVTLDPDLKEKLFQGRINVFQCQKCGVRALIPVPLLYHDMTKRFCVQFYPYNWLENDDFLENFAKDGELNIELFSIPKASGYMKRTQIVFDMDELVRYVLFRDKLHERSKKAS